MIQDIIIENDRRKAINNKYICPITGENAPGTRTLLEIPDYSLPKQWIPAEAERYRLIRLLRKHKSIEQLILNEYPDEDYDLTREYICKQLIKIRCKVDFIFCAAMYIFIKPKLGGDDIHFLLNRAQRKLLAKLEGMRLAGKPIRIILLKARQWGGSTLIQIYMTWIQLFHKKGWNSIIVGHVKDTSLEVKGMFSKLMENMPLWLIDDEATEPKVSPFEGSQNIDIINARNCKVKVGTAEKPDSARGGDSSMAHCTEVALWTKTDNKTPEQVVKSVCSGIPNTPLSMKIYESTANGTGNFFATEWERAKRGQSDMQPLFIAWFDIDMYQIPIDNYEEFVRELIANKDNERDYGKYLWWLWTKGATLEAINWYKHTVKGYNNHDDMASEFPSDDIEAFTHSGKKIFDLYDVEKLKKTCRAPQQVGDLYAKEIKGKDALKDIRFIQGKGELKIWEFPDVSINVANNRYIVIVDIGGRAKGSDFSDILVIDRYWMIEGDRPEVVAEWHGHIDHDLLAWKAAQIASFYNNALLIIESNTLETKYKKMQLDGNQAPYILDQISEHYSNLYARDEALESIAEHVPRKFGFHTNTNTKPALISKLIEMVREQGWIERDVEALDEFLTYEKKPDGSYGALDGKHDDKLMTRGIGLFLCYKLELPKIIIKIERAPRKQINSYASI